MSPLDQVGGPASRCDEAGDYDAPVTGGFALAARRGELAEDAIGGSVEPGSVSGGENPRLSGAS